MSDTVQKIKERLSILEVVGSYVELHKAGKHYKGKSPFTSEKTPSFFVSPDRGVFYCFSSQKGGDMFTFVEEMEGVDFKGALKLLADRAGVALVAEDPSKRSERENQYALLEEATQFFTATQEAHPAVGEYIENRGVHKETVIKWRIGYAPDAWRSLRAHLASKKFTDAQMLAAGLIKRADGGKEPYDVFRDRVMFPLADSSGRIVGFSGRTLKSGEGIPKYVNSPETDLYKKSEILFGYDKARSGIRQYDFSLIVEGQFDVVLSHQAGYSNAVAVSGTALTPHHIGLLERLSARAVLALDADRAGVSAVKRSSTLMLAHGMDIKVATMEGGKDPADMVRTDPKAFKRVIGEAVHVVEFLLKILARDTKDERAYKLRVREELLPIVAQIPNSIDQDHFEGVIATATGTTKEAIHQELLRIKSLPNTAPGVATSPVAVIRPATTRRDDLLRYVRGLRDVLKVEHPDIASMLMAALSSFLTESEAAHFESIPDAAVAEVTFTIERDIADIKLPRLTEEIEHSLTSLSHLLARERLNTLRSAMQDAESRGDEVALGAHIQETKAAEGLLQGVVRLGPST